MKYKCIVGIILLLLAISSVAESIKGDANGDGRVSVADIAIIASHIMGDNPTGYNEKQADVNGDGRVSVADISALATLIMGGDIVNSVEETKKDTLYIKYSGSNVSFIGNELEDVKITHDQADVQVTIGENPNVVLNLSGKSDDGRLSIKSDTLVTLQLAGIDLTSSHAPAVNSYGKQKVNVELVDGTKNQLRDSKTYTFTDAEEIANGCFSVQGALSFTGKGELTLRGKSKHAIYAKKSITFKGGTYNVLEAASDAIHSGKSVTIEGGDFKLNGMKSEAIELDNDFTMEAGSIEMNITGAGAKGIQCGGDLNISGGTIQATASGALKNKDGDLSYCSIIKCDGNATITNGEFHLTNNSPGGKCISTDGDIVITGGKYNLATHGDGAAYTNTSNETDYYTSRCLHSKGNMTITACKLNCLSTGIGSKGIDCGQSLVIGSYQSYLNDNIDITVRTEGTCIVNDIDEDKRFGCPKGIKSGNIIYIYGGNILVETQGMGGEGIESKNMCKIVDGNIECYTFDDGINVNENLTIEGGNILCVSENNDGFDSNKDMYIKGGVVVGMSKQFKEESFDADSGNFFVTGGLIAGIGNGRVWIDKSVWDFYQSGYSFLDVFQPSEIKANSDRYLSIVDGDDVIMSIYNMDSLSYINLFVCSSVFSLGKKYDIYESSDVLDYTESFFSGKFKRGGRLSMDANKINEIVINNKYPTE